MKLGFDSERGDACVAALLVHQVYTSRDVRRFKTSLDMWSRIERQVKASAKRSGSLSLFLERLMPRLNCDVLRPLRDNVAASVPGAPRDFGSLTALLDNPPAPPAAVLRCLYRETSLIVLLVRERLERDRAARAAAKAAGADDETDDGDDLADAA